MPNVSLIPPCRLDPPLVFEYATENVVVEYAVWLPGRNYFLPVGLNIAERGEPISVYPMGGRIDVELPFDA